ncbi:hypothetical protein [Synechococcus phage S-N03]|uniref:Uncharacterized protein n=1 Tax=Synechococcus phage S-N03 TaxID=2718943 RepID=A0A6G8R638_9CAUD|nr:hypothetical protein PQC09_gp223 [Synechococcus phage S-N03]QIN96844.1 hypothetical protein [Synechococcus phage S-N03]
MKKPLPLGKMSAQAFHLDSLAYVTEDNEKKHRLESQARMIRITMDSDERL